MLKTIFLLFSFFQLTSCATMSPGHIGAGSGLVSNGSELERYGSFYAGLGVSLDRESLHFRVTKYNITNMPHTFAADFVWKQKKRPWSWSAKAGYGESQYTDPIRSLGVFRKFGGALNYSLSEKVTSPFNPVLHVGLEFLSFSGASHKFSKKKVLTAEAGVTLYHFE